MLQGDITVYFMSQNKMWKNIDFKSNNFVLEVWSRNKIETNKTIVDLQKEYRAIN